MKRETLKIEKREGDKPKSDPVGEAKDSKARTIKLNNAAYDLYAAGKKEEALAAYEKIIRQEEADDCTHNSRGVILGESGQYLEAIESFSEAIKINSREVAERKKQRERDPSMLFDKRDQELAHPMVALGKALYILKKYEEAVVAFKNAVSTYQSKEVRGFLDLANNKVTEKTKNRGKTTIVSGMSRAR